jgi:hypothetical protein
LLQLFTRNSEKRAIKEKPEAAYAASGSILLYAKSTEE